MGRNNLRLLVDLVCEIVRHGLFSVMNRPYRVCIDCAVSADITGAVRRMPVSVEMVHVTRDETQQRI